MAASVNKAIIVGNLGKDPEIRYFPDGSPTATLSVATTSAWNDKNTGEKKEHTEWHRIVLYGRQAEICAQYLSKGKQVYIEGRLQTRQWEDKEGIKRYTTEIIASNMQMLGTRADAGNQTGAAGQGGYAQGSAPQTGGSPPGGYQASPASSGGYQSGAAQGNYQEKQSTKAATPAPPPEEDYQNPGSPGGANYPDDAEPDEIRESMDTPVGAVPPGDGPEDDDIPF